MGILPDFLIKHVRPYGIDAYQFVCTPGPGSLTAWLLQNGVDQPTIDTAFASWATTANLPITDANIPTFIASAEVISEARWSELYTTNYSTILFLNEPLLKELSYVSSQNAGADFNFDPAEHIPLAVTINNQGAPPTSTQVVSGASLAADANGNCCHFGGLILLRSASDGSCRSYDGASVSAGLPSNQDVPLRNA